MSPRTLIRPFLGWWVALFWCWLLLAGTWDAVELEAAGAAAALAAVAAAVVHALGLLRFPLRLRWLRPLLDVPGQVLVDFGILALALARSLARRRPVAGAFRARTVDAGRPDDPRDAARRAVLAAIATYSPNAYVVDVDAERQLVLVHDLVPRRASEEPL